MKQQLDGQSLYNQVATDSARLITDRYSTSFGLAVSLLGSTIRPHIYNIYGFVRLGDEIVDTIRGPRAKQNLDEFISQTKNALRYKFSTNLVLHAFAQTVESYNIEYDLIEAFFESMRSDLSGAKSISYQHYIYGSAEVVGLMCLHVFCEGDKKLYQALTPAARALGAAFQKVNFLRDMSADNAELGRYYFPNQNFEKFNEAGKRRIISDIQKDIARARRGIERLPDSSKYGVLIATEYFDALTNKLERTPVEAIKRQRQRIGILTRITIIIRIQFRRLMHS